MSSESDSRTSIKFSFTTLFLILFLSFGYLSSHADNIDMTKWSDGKALFKANCSACHNPKADGTGPALMGATARWQAAGDYKGKTGLQWMHIWIHNWHDAVNGGYKYAIDMRNSRPAEMNVFPNLNDANIDNILLYVNNPDAGTPANAAPQPGTAPAGEVQPQGPSMALYLFVLFLVVLVAILVGVTNKLDKIIDEKDGTPQPPKKPFWKGPRFITAVCLIAFVYLGYVTVDATVHLSRQTGYSPVQPIRFPHDLHAGKYKIDCQYCHQTAYKGKHANIPTLNTCMNCHKQISKGPEFGTTEIAKIYDAVGWDPILKTYSKTPHPVEWIRIHNLPDYVFFSHAQHVNAGKIQCQTCHGPIEMMHQVYQYAPLSMGWCINCHRNTDVQFNTNNYYTSNYASIHDALKNHDIDRVTVETIGGTECQKCHY